MNIMNIKDQIETDIDELELHMENHKRAFDLLQKATQRLVKAKLAHMYSHCEKIVHYDDGEKKNKSLYALYDVTIEEFNDAVSNLESSQKDFDEATSKINTMIATVAHYDMTSGFDNINEKC